MEIDTKLGMLSDAELVEKVDGLVGEEKHLEAARAIRKIRDKSMISSKHENILNKAKIIEYVFLSSWVEICCFSVS